LLSLLLLTFLILPTQAKNQIHLRGGSAFANYDGVTSGELRNTNTADVEFEVLLNNKKSYFFRTTQAFDLDKSIVTYSYLGGGMKYYLFTRGMYFETRDGPEVVITSPRWRIYMGWEIGVAHVVLQTIGEILQINTSTYDYGITTGTIYNLTDRLGLEINFTAQISTGFTTISTGAAVMKFMGGFSYFL
jgi:hypothetical protein